MKAIILFLITLVPCTIHAQSGMNTKWIKRGSLQTDGPTIFVASKYIVPDGALQQDSSFYYDGEFVILADRFDNDLFNSESYVDIFKFDQDKCIIEESLAFTDLSHNFNNPRNNKVVLLPIQICSDYIAGLVFEVSKSNIKKLFELEMWRTAEISVKQLERHLYSVRYNSSNGDTEYKFKFE